MSAGGPRTGSRPLSGVFRSDRQPAMAHNGRFDNRGISTRGTGQMSRGNRQTGPNSVMRSDGPSVRNGGGGVVRGGRNPQNVGQQRQVQQRSNNSRSSTPSTYNRGETRRSTPSYTPSTSSPRSSMPSSVGRSGGSRSSSPSYGGGGGRSGGGGGVSRGGVSRGGRR